MRWYARYEMDGTLDLGQQELVLEGKGIVGAHFDEDARLVELILAVEAPDYYKAPTSASYVFDKLNNVKELIAGDVLSEPYRITVESQAAAGRAPGLLSTSATARRLGWSDARVRQMKGTIGFPTAHNIPGAAGDFYLAVQVAEYKRRRDQEAKREHPDPGRPRATDEAQMDSALTFLSNYHALSDAEARQISDALRAKGGRSVRGKARVLMDVFNHRSEEFAHEFGPSVGMAEWLRRAQEITGN